MPPKDLKLNYKNPIVAVDGQSIFINEKGPVNLVFFQFREENPQEVSTDVVAAVRLHSIDELRQLGRQIKETIKQHESREE